MIRQLALPPTLISGREHETLREAINALPLVDPFPEVRVLDEKDPERKRLPRPGYDNQPPPLEWRDLPWDDAGIPVWMSAWLTSQEFDTAQVLYCRHETSGQIVFAQKD